MLVSDSGSGTILIQLGVLSLAEHCHTHFKKGAILGKKGAILGKKGAKLGIGPLQFFLDNFFLPS